MFGSPVNHDVVNLSRGRALRRRRVVSVQLDADLPDDTKLWAALQRVGGGTWGGCVYDVDRITEAIKAGEAIIDSQE